MNITPVLVVLNEGSNYTSTTIQTITYDLSNRILGIVFKSRVDIIYLYSEVNILMYSQFLVSDSIGSAYNKLIKPNYLYSVQDSIDYIQMFSKTLLKI